MKETKQLYPRSYYDKHGRFDMQKGNIGTVHNLVVALKAYIRCKTCKFWDTLELMYFYHNGMQAVCRSSFLEKVQQFGSCDFDVEATTNQPLTLKF